LLLHRCDDCGIWHHPPRPVCPACWSSNLTPTEVAGTGTIFMFVLLHQGPPAEGVGYSTPHPVVTVELDEQPGLRFTSTIVGSPNEAISIGARVALDWVERDGDPLPVFRIVDGGAA
ncbi:MAG TPA: OB-fold domain-containing protein, partial [Mycobacteriales bacterium]|nr:OB-fold domain-containing protein [Mycobacteriales bacterium]